MREDANIFVQVDKIVVKITGLDIRGLNIQQLEHLLRDKLHGLVRVIGVTGESLEMDVYGLDEADILRDPNGLITTVALADGISVSDLTQLSQAEKIHRVDVDHLPPYREKGCQAERWLMI